MNPKQTIPAIAKIAPPLLIGFVIFMAVKSLFSDDDTEKKPETTPANTEPENRRKEAETTPASAAPPRPALVIPLFSGGNSAQNGSILPISGGKPNGTPPAPAPAPKIPVPPPPSAIPAMKITPQIPLPAPKKFVTREDLAGVFQRGARGLTRTTAVAALKNLGFGKTAAYDALSENGRFSAWLRFTPDGIITWTDR
jgi:hypothetical protein